MLSYLIKKEVVFLLQEELQTLTILIIHLLVMLQLEAEKQRV